MADAPEKKRRHGPKPKPPHEQRRHAVSCRLTDAESEMLDARRGNVSRGEYLRLAALKAPPRVVPEINKVAWSDLSRAASNLNQLTRAINEKRWPLKEGPTAQQTITDLRASLNEVRAKLIGLDGDK